MEDLLEKVNERFEEKNNIIKSQKDHVYMLTRQVSVLQRDLAIKEAELNQANGRWNKLQKALKGVQP